MTTNFNDYPLEEIGYVLYDPIDENCLSIIEIKTTFNLRKAKIKNKHMISSKIYKLQNKDIIYIETLNKWYYNDELYKKSLIEKTIYKNPEEVIEDPHIQEDEKIEITEEIDYDLIKYGYLLFNYTNLNKILAKEYKSKHNIENDKESTRKSHISKIYSKKDYHNIKFIKKINKWYYNPKKFSINDLNLKLYDTFEEVQQREEINSNKTNIKKDINQDTDFNFKIENMRRLNEKSYLKDLKFKGYILLKFIEKNVINYEIFEKYESAKEYQTDFNQIYKCFSKRNTPNIIYIKTIKKWLNLEDTNNILYDKENKIPIIKNNLIEINEEILTENKNIDNDKIINLKDIIKNHKLILNGWLYYEKFNNENELIVRQYKSSNQLLNRLENSKGKSSQLFRCKDNENLFYIKELNKWFNNDKNIENEDNIIKIQDEIEIFE